MAGLTTTLKKVFRPLYYAFINHREVVIRKPDVLNGFKWIADQRFGRAYYKGYHEPKIVDFLRTHASDGDNFLDIGGHAGYFSFLFSRLSPNGSVYTFEPNPQNAQFIRKIVELNSVRNVKLFENAVGSKDETLAFEAGPNSSTSKIARNGNVKVSVITLDSMFQKSVGRAIMKIDVEGFGGEVIRGAMRIITESRPTIIMEVHANSDERDSLDALSKIGYSFYDLDMKPEKVNNEDCGFFVAMPLNVEFVTLE